MEAISNYLINERLLGLSAGLIGVASILLALLFFIYLPQFKVFALTMLAIGAIEAGIFIPNYFTAEKRIDAQLELAKNDLPTYIQSQVEVSKKALHSFFVIKIFYATFLLFGVILISKIDSSTFIGIATGIILHLGLAITIDNFGERYTKTYQQEMIEYVAKN